MADARKTGAPRGTGKVTQGRKGARRSSSGGARRDSAPERETDVRQGERRQAEGDGDAQSDASREETRKPSGAARSGRASSPKRGLRDRTRLSERMDRSTRIRLFLQSSVLDFVLVLVVASGLVFTVSFGFHSAWDYRGNVVLIGGLVAVLLLCLFVGSWSKRAVPLSVAATLIAAVAMIAVATVTSPVGGDMFVDGQVNDVPENYALFVVVLVVTTVITYLLSRRTVGLVFLLLLAIIACGAVQFVWREWISEQPGIPATVIVLTGIGMLFIYQCYKQSVYSAKLVKSTSFAGAFAFSALVAVACVSIGAAGFYGVVQFAGLTTPEVKPFESHVSPPIDEKAEAYQKMEEEGNDTSDNTSDDVDETDQTAEGGDRSGIGGAGLLSGSFVESAAHALSGFDPDNPEQDYRNIEYLIVTYETIIVVLLILLVILLVVALQRFRRDLRLKAISKKSYRYQVWYLYTFLIERLRRLKVEKPDHLTPLEFAVGFSKPMLPFTRGTDGVDFVEVSSLYQDAVFGGYEPDVVDMERLKGYYRAFFKNARQYSGLPRWILWRFWRV